jgi:YesN/AraC family two-component response regulator
MDKINTIYTSRNGKEAWDCFKKNRIDMIISDYQMPLLNGLEFLKLVKEKSPDIPFALLATHPNSVVYQEGIRSSVTEIIEKPISDTELETVLDKLLKLAENVKMLKTRTRKNVIEHDVFQSYLSNKQKICQGQSNIDNFKSKQKKSA